MTNTEIHKEINSRIFLQAQHLSSTLNFGQTKEYSIIAQTLDVTLKLQAMVYHIENYKILDKQYLNKAVENFHEFPSAINNCCSLIYELEAFLFQLKSALDMAIKVTGELLPNHFKSQTFGNNGEHFIKNLEIYKKVRIDRSELIESIIEMVKDDQKTWLRESIELRNTISHYKSIGFFAYKITRENEKIIVQKPKILNKDPQSFMESTFRNCMEFIQDLISFSIILFLPKPFVLSKPNVPDSWHNDGVGKFIKYSLGIDTSRTTIKELNSES
ncbi:MAG: hypothetical protein ACYDIB_10130 [Desulfobulbia bacterium]